MLAFGTGGQGRSVQGAERTCLSVRMLLALCPAGVSDQTRVAKSSRLHTAGRGGPGLQPPVAVEWASSETFLELRSER